MTIVTPAEVADFLRLSVDVVDIAKAQSIVEDVTGLDLADTTDLSAGDLRLLRRAVMWQVAYLDEHPEVLTAQGNVVQASANGTSITFGQAAEDGWLAPLAARSLKGLSWVRRGLEVSTIRPQPREDYEQQPDPWGTVSRSMRVRP